MVVFTESERGCHEVYLCHAPSAVREGGANKVSVSIWHTHRLRAWGKVADQSTGQGAVFDDALDATSNARRSVMWTGVRMRGRSSARPDQAGVGAWRVTPPGVKWRSRRGVVSGLLARVI